MSKKEEIIQLFLDDSINIEKLILFFDTYNKTNSDIKNNGVVYTPLYICDYIVSKLSPTLTDTILEPSVGHGIFIISLLNFIKNKYQLSSLELKKYFLQNVYVSDINITHISEYKEIISLYFYKLQQNIDVSEIIQAYNLDTITNIYKISSSFDIIFGNPPYVRTKNIYKKYLSLLRNKYISCSSGNIDLYYAFIELAFNYSKKSSMIVPNSWIYNKSALSLRKLIYNNLQEIIDFKDFNVFKNVSTYVSIFLIDKQQQNNVITYKNNLNDTPTFLNKENIKSNSYSFYHDNFYHDFQILKYHTPLATLRDKIFINHNLNADNKDLIPFFKLSKIKIIEDLLSPSSIVNPYKKVDEKFIIKSENDLELSTLDYLKLHITELNKRDKGKVNKYPAWYAYGRQQGLNLYRENTDLIIIPGMFNLSFKFFKIDRKKMPKYFFFSSGFIFEVNKSDSFKVVNFLNSDTFKLFVKNNGKIWKGKFEPYYSISITQFKDYFENY